MKRVFKNWITTLCGVVLAVLSVASTKDVETSTLIISGATALLGAVAKDPDLMGGK
jgi:hypothetical protein